MVVEQCNANTRFIKHFSVIPSEGNTFICPYKAHSPFLFSSFNVSAPEAHPPLAEALNPPGATTLIIQHLTFPFAPTQTHSSFLFSSFNIHHLTLNISSLLLSFSPASLLGC
jgi:hypothetical protein